MQAIRIAICPKTQLEPAFPEIKPESEMTFEAVAILEHGCASGNAALGFVLKGADGTHHIAQMTENIFDGVAAALKGANERFGISKN